CLLHGGQGEAIGTRQAADGRRRERPQRRRGRGELGHLGCETAPAPVWKPWQRTDRAATLGHAGGPSRHGPTQRPDGAQAGHRHQSPHPFSYDRRSAAMKSTRDRTEAKARLPTSSSGMETRKRSSTSTTSSSASIESSPSPSPKIGESSGMSLGGRSSRSPVTRSCFTSAASAFRSIAALLRAS